MRARLKVRIANREVTSDEGRIQNRRRRQPHDGARLAVGERYIDDRYKSAAPKMGIAPASGRRTFLVEGEPFTREKGKYPMAAPGFLQDRAQGDGAFRAREPSSASAPRAACRTWTSRASTCRFSIRPSRARCSGARFRDAELLAACCRAYNNWAIDYCSANPQRLQPAAILPMQDVDEGRHRSESRGQTGAVSFYVRPNPVDGSFDFRRLLPAAVDRGRKARPADFDSRFGFVVGAVVRRPDGHARQRPYPVASVRGDGRDGRTHLVRRDREVPEAQGRPGRGRRRMGAVLAAADGAALELQRQLGA